MNLIALATRAKGPFALLKRTFAISRRYGFVLSKMDRALAQFVRVLRQFDCSATFPITAVTLARNSALIEKVQAQGIEFAVHGYRHVDHSQLSHAQQLVYLAQARQIFAKANIRLAGFRSPYLHWNPDMLAALRRQGFVYDSSQGLAWDVLHGCETPAYHRALNFYGALSANDYPSLPGMKKRLVCIPYSLPDDEALVERLTLKTTEQMGNLWLAILRRTYELGELFTLGLHPERFTICQEPLAAVLTEARSLTPSVWIARLDEIAAWWRARTESAVEITDTDDDRFQVTVNGPPGVTVLARAVQVEAPTRPWADGYQQVDALSFTVRADKRPFIGVALHTSTRLVSFLRQQGYLVETVTDARPCALYIDQADFTKHDERALLARLEEAQTPLVRLGRWPDGARSALAVTGDIDALTLWDYALRIVGR